MPVYVLPECYSPCLPSSMSGMTASTTNYLWSMQDVLGQGATASVFKARHKVESPTLDDFIIKTDRYLVMEPFIDVIAAVALMFQPTSRFHCPLRMRDKKTLWL